MRRPRHHGRPSPKPPAGPPVELDIDAVGGDIGDRSLYTSGTTMSSLVVETKLMAYLPKIMRPAAVCSTLVTVAVTVSS